MIRETIGELDLVFETAPSLFSPKGLDPGTRAMLRHARFEPGDKVLDLGCGYGPVGVYAALVVKPEAVWMVDIDPVAVDYARRNLRLNGAEGASVVQSDGFADVREAGFTKILCNPPYHTDFSVPKHLIEKGFNRLTIGGTLWMVTKRDAWYRNKLRSIFGKVQVHEEAGYFVFEAKKSSATYANRSGR